MATTSLPMNQAFIAASRPLGAVQFSASLPLSGGDGSCRQPSFHAMPSPRFSHAACGSCSGPPIAGDHILDFPFKRAQGHTPRGMARIVQGVRQFTAGREWPLRAVDFAGSSASYWPNRQRQSRKKRPLRSANNGSNGHGPASAIRHGGPRVIRSTSCDTGTESADETVTYHHCAGIHMVRVPGMPCHGGQHAGENPRGCC